MEPYAGGTPPPVRSLDVEVDGVLREAGARGWETFHLVGYSGGCRRGVGLCRQTPGAPAEPGPATARLSPTCRKHLGPAGESGRQFRAAPLDINDDGGSTLIASLTTRFGKVLWPGECQISLSQVGPGRAKLLDLRAPDPALVLTQYVRHANRPFYVAKCLIAARAGHLSVMQSLES